MAVISDSDTHGWFPQPAPMVNPSYVTTAHLDWVNPANPCALTWYLISFKWIVNSLGSNMTMAGQFDPAHFGVYLLEELKDPQVQSAINKSIDHTKINDNVSIEMSKFTSPLPSIKPRTTLSSSPQNGPFILMKLNANRAVNLALLPAT